MTGAARDNPSSGPPDADPVALLSHELRTPLNAIIGFAEMLDGQVLGDVGNQRYRDYARYILESGAHLRDVIADVLNILSDHDRSAAARIVAFDPASAVDAALRLVAMEAEAAEVRLAGPGAGPDVRLLVERDAVARILAMLLRDAIAGAGPGDRITVTCGLPAGRRELVYAVTRSGASARRRPAVPSGDRPAPAPRTPMHADPRPAILHWLVRLSGGRLDLDPGEDGSWRARVGFSDSLLVRLRRAPSDRPDRG